jgi:hypothetical protein
MKKHKAIIFLLYFFICFFSLLYYGLKAYRFDGPKQLDLCIEEESKGDISAPIFVSGIPGNGFFIKWIRRGEQRNLYIEVWGKQGKSIPVIPGRLKIKFSDDNKELSIYNEDKLIYKDSDVAYLKARSFRNEGVGFSSIDSITGEGLVRVLGSDCKASFEFFNKLNRRNIFKLSPNQILHMSVAFILILISFASLPFILFGLWKSQKAK